MRLGRGTVVVVELDPTVGHEQHGVRPCVLVSDPDVISDQRFPRDGRYIEQVGTYDPRIKTGGVQLNQDKINAWIKKGAKPSQTVSELIKKQKKAS